jgi:hypothetical protein
MANYSVNLTDNGDGTFTITNLLRNPTSNASGGTNLLTNTYTQSATTGALLTASGFLDSATDTGDGLGHKLRTPSECLERCSAIVRNDRSFNG